MPSNAVTILVIDDEPPIRRLLDQPTPQGYEVIEAETAVAGLAEIRRHEPEIPSFSISACRIRTGSMSSAPSAALRRCRSSYYRAAATSAARSRRSSSAPTTT